MNRAGMKHVIGTAKLNDVGHQALLTWNLDQIADDKINRLDELTQRC